MGDLCRLYLDESGVHKYHNYDNPKRDNIEDRYLALMGVIIEKESYLQTHDDLETLKRKHFDSDPDNPVVLHRDEIVKKRMAFKVLQEEEKEKAFNDDLIDFLRALDCILILVVLDKKYLKEKYKYPVHPYHWALELMLERYCGYLNYLNKKGDVLAEHRGGEEDMKLKEAYIKVYEKGTSQQKRSDFQTALISKQIKIKPKEKNIAGLQIADILANPCKQELLFEKGRTQKQEATFGRIVCESIGDKYNKRFSDGKVDGIGKVFRG